MAESLGAKAELDASQPAASASRGVLIKSKLMISGRVEVRVKHEGIGSRADLDTVPANEMSFGELSCHTGV